MTVVWGLGWPTEEGGTAGYIENAQILHQPLTISPLLLLIRGHADHSFDAHGDLLRNGYYKYLDLFSILVVFCVWVVH